MTTRPLLDQTLRGCQSGEVKWLQNTEAPERARKSFKMKALFLFTILLGLFVATHGKQGFEFLCHDQY